MNEPRPRLKLKLDGDTLILRRLSNDGEHLGKRYRWKIKAKSNVPQTLYHLIHSFVRNRVGQCEDTDFHSVKKAVLRALCEVAEACGCTHSFGAEYGDVTWFLNGAPIFAFQIHDKFVRKGRARELRSSAATFRWILKVQDGTFVRYLPRRTSTETCRGK